MGVSKKKEQRDELTLTRNLIILERGKDELLLVNSIDSKPLYIKRGRDYVKGFLDAVKELARKNGKTVMEPLPVLEQLWSLLGNAIWRQIRRTSNHGFRVCSIYV